MLHILEAETQEFHWDWVRSFILVYTGFRLRLGNFWREERLNVPWVGGRELDVRMKGIIKFEAGTKDVNATAPMVRSTRQDKIRGLRGLWTFIL